MSFYDEPADNPYLPYVAMVGDYPGSTRDALMVAVMTVAAEMRTANMLAYLAIAKEYDGLVEEYQSPMFEYVRKLLTQPD